ncbi:MAG TPA: hypothetical protein VLA12_23590 [Planctomycetaceae bacterium]|nr:hypothetical protein [Planctomycetaceae bacterium]
MYTVVWLKSVHHEVGEIWLAASNRNAVTAASAEIDRELAVDAEEKGKPLSEGLRVYDAPPLRAVYTVDPGNRLVEVCRIRLL